MAFMFLRWFMRQSTTVWVISFVVVLGLGVAFYVGGRESNGASVSYAEAATFDDSAPTELSGCSVDRVVVVGTPRAAGTTRSIIRRSLAIGGLDANFDVGTNEAEITFSPAVDGDVMVKGSFIAQLVLELPQMTRLDVGCIEGQVISYF